MIEVVLTSFCSQEAYLAFNAGQRKYLSPLAPSVYQALSTRGLNGTISRSHLCMFFPGGIEYNMQLRTLLPLTVEHSIS